VILSGLHAHGSPRSLCAQAKATGAGAGSIGVQDFYSLAGGKASARKTAGDRARDGAYYTRAGTAAESPSRHVIHITDDFCARTSLGAWAVTMSLGDRRIGAAGRDPLMARIRVAAEHRFGQGARFLYPARFANEA